MTSLTFYGGVNEVGGNKILLEDKDTKVFLDFGMSFGKRGAYFDEFMSPRTAAGLRRGAPRREPGPRGSRWR